jgi:hypothetical protein
MKFKHPSNAIKWGKKYHFFNPRNGMPKLDDDNDYYYITVCGKGLFHPKEEYIKDIQKVSNLKSEQLCERCLGPLEIIK